jgi:hypothetical protein
MVECTECTFKWRSRTSANAVNAYHSEVAEKQARAESKRKSKSKTKPNSKD